MNECFPIFSASSLGLLKYQHWQNLKGSSGSLAIAEAAQALQHPLLVIVPDPQQAQQIELELHFFLKSTTLEILLFPDWETLPYDKFSPHQDIISQRLSILQKLPSLRRGIIIITAQTIMHRFPPRNFLGANTFSAQVGEIFQLEKIRTLLIQYGYRLVQKVLEHGEFSIRGSILDLYPMGSELPIRIDLLDDEIDSIRTFDPDTQRSLERMDQVRLLPAHEFPLTHESITNFKLRWNELFGEEKYISRIYQNIKEGISPSGIEYFIPLFFNEMEKFADYLPENTSVFSFGDIATAMEAFSVEILNRYEQLKHDIQHPILNPKFLFLEKDEVFHVLKKFLQIKINHPETSKKTLKFPVENTPIFFQKDQNKVTSSLDLLKNFIEKSEASFLFLAETEGRREVLLEFLKTIDIYPKSCNSWGAFLKTKENFAICVAPISEGFLLTERNIALVTEAQIFGQHVIQRRRKKSRGFDGDILIKSLSELSIGEAVVHVEHGVGRYQGLQNLTVGGISSEYLVLEYAEQARIYVPVNALHFINRYSGVDGKNIPLHKLGSDQWQKARRKAAEKINDIAAELLDIYAQRAAKKGFEFHYSEEDYQHFVSAFPFEETPDQEQAIQQVITDMRSSKTMDRLICGDVGFGKTEVAMRATFISVMSGKQTCVLVPTTLLAEQHYRNFQDRFANWPVRIEMLSRFRTKKEIDHALKQLESGKVDIIIGTHRLLQNDVKFKNLGLLIIDEEHRFGVKQKEKLKSMRSEVDILTLTATPIPRTLNMALSGIRDLSIIATPPARRLSIKTFVHTREKPLIREAILREVLRGGQVYFLHNHVESIPRVVEEISELLPEVKVHFAHGQMHENELEKIMADFYHQRFNVLICTTIIETGIDIPSANTIIIDRADRFGLAQLHQLRGRVGRSHHQAYAYLMIPDESAITEDAKKRLDAIASLEDLGAGFTLATHDLEIRGVGELLGEEQSGDIQSIGFALYSDLLDKAVKSLREGKTPSLETTHDQEIHLNLQISAFIPEAYVADVHERLVLYKRIANAKFPHDLHELKAEIIDRFGTLPNPTKQLFEMGEIKLNAEKISIKKIDLNGHGGRIEFFDRPNVDPSRIIHLIQTQPKEFRLDGSNRLRFMMELADDSAKLFAVKNVISKLIQKNT